jgi:hemoglobin
MPALQWAASSAAEARKGPWPSDTHSGTLDREWSIAARIGPRLHIAALFGGKVSEQHRVHVTDWWAEVMGGPAVYTEQRGGYERMLGRHENLAITREQRLEFVTLLSRAADDVGLPSDPEFRAAIMGYAEWGTRLAMHNSQPGARTVAHAPVPRWGWGVARPFPPDPGEDT